MSLTTRYPGHLVIAEDPENLIFGTAMLGDLYGSVESADITREASWNEVTKANGVLLAVLATNPKFVLSLNTLFVADVTPPGLGERIVFPLAGISGRVKNGAKIAWTKDGHRMLTIPADSWDAFGDQGAGTARAVSYSGTTPVFTTIS